MGSTSLKMNEDENEIVFPRRLIRDRINPLDFMNDRKIVKRYKLSRPMIYELCDDLDDDLNHYTTRNAALPVVLQILVALRYFATGSFQTMIGDVHGVEQSTVSRVVER